MISPGLIQKSYGAESARALRIGVALNARGADGLRLRSGPARDGRPSGAGPHRPLPTSCCRPSSRELLPPWLGALALAAVFSTEVDTCDAILFMISTSVSKDLFQRYLRPAHPIASCCWSARVAAVAGGALGVLLSIYLSTIVQAMTVFYSLLGVSLFVPVLGGLYVAARTAGRGAGRHRRGCRGRCSWYALGLPDATRGWTRH